MCVGDAIVGVRIFGEIGRMHPSSASLPPSFVSLPCTPYLPPCRVYLYLTYIPACRCLPSRTLVRLVLSACCLIRCRRMAASLAAAGNCCFILNKQPTSALPIYTQPP